MILVARYVQPTRRRFFAGAGAVGVVVGLLVLGGGEWFYGVLLLVVAVTFVLVARTEIETTDEGVAIRNPFRRRFVAWHEIESVGYGRLPFLQLHGGDKIRLEGVEPFPQAFPSEKSRKVFSEFVDDVESHVRTS